MIKAIIIMSIIIIFILINFLYSHKIRSIILLLFNKFNVKFINFTYQSIMILFFDIILNYQIDMGNI